MSEKKQNNPAELNENNLEGVSGGTIGFHIFDDATSGWVASGSPGVVFKSSAEAREADKANGCSGKMALEEMNAPIRKTSSSCSSWGVSPPGGVAAPTTWGNRI